MDLLIGVLLGIGAMVAGRVLRDFMNAGKETTLDLKCPDCELSFKYIMAGSSDAGRQKYYLEKFRKCPRCGHGTVLAEDGRSRR